MPYWHEKCEKRFETLERTETLENSLGELYRKWIAEWEQWIAGRLNERDRDGVEGGYEDADTV